MEDFYLLHCLSARKNDRKNFVMRLFLTLMMCIVVNSNRKILETTKKIKNMGEYFHISCKSKISDGSIFKQKKLMWTFKKQVTFFKNKKMNSTLERETKP